MNNRDKQLWIITVVFLALFLLSLVGFSVFVLQIKDIKNSIREQVQVNNQYIEETVNKAVDDRLNKAPVPEKGEDGKTIAGPKGDTGRKGEKGDTGAKGSDGKDAKPCTTIDKENGATIKCPDGTTSDVKDGEDAKQTLPCQLLGGQTGYRFIDSLVCFRILP